MFIVKDICSQCGNGSLGIRVCGGTEHHLLVWCDECDAIWLHPNLEGDPYYLEPAQSNCPLGDGTLSSPASFWASEDDIRKKDWWDYVIGESQSPEEWRQDNSKTRGNRGRSNSIID